MADFQQNGLITTLHNLSDRPVEALEAELMQFSKKNPMALVLPSLYSELEGPALHNIVEKIKNIPYLTEIIIGLDRADEEQYRKAKQFFSRLPQRHRVLWNDGPRLREVDELLRKHGLSPTELGKGRNVWYMFGYFLASNRCTALALHDCDILTYERDMVAKLFYPLVHPTFTFKFAKGYYYRASDTRLNGRVTRLLVTPLIRALKMVIGDNEYLNYIDSFRYPLAGEFAMVWDLVHSIRIPSDWGLEIGVLSEARRLFSNQRICQVDIADSYDHKHQDLSENDPNRGLAKMSNDIAKAFFRKLAINGETFSTGRFRTIKAAYYRLALDYIEQYHADAVFNGLTVDRHQEERAIELFSQSIMRAGEQFLANPMEQPHLPSWNRVIAAVPEVYEKLLAAVEADMADA